MDRIDGVEYHTVSRRSAMYAASPTGSLPIAEGTSTSVAACRTGR
jgi:hypothetical protein